MLPVSCFFIQSPSSAVLAILFLHVNVYYSSSSSLVSLFLLLSLVTVNAAVEVRLGFTLAVVVFETVALALVMTLAADGTCGQLWDALFLLVDSQPRQKSCFQARQALFPSGSRLQHHTSLLLVGVTVPSINEKGWGMVGSGNLEKRDCRIAACPWRLLRAVLRQCDPPVARCSGRSPDPSSFCCTHSKRDTKI